MEPNLQQLCARARFHLPADAVLTGATALPLDGIGVGASLPIRAATRTTAQTRRAAVRLSRVHVLLASVDNVAIPCAAWRDARLDLDLVGLVAAGDALVRRGLTTLEELKQVAAETDGRRCRLLRRAAGLVRKRVDSVPETRLRLSLVLAGLPEPRCNVRIGHDDRIIGRVDLLLEEYGLIIEYDGDQHRGSGQWNVDLDRDDAFTSATFTTIRVTRQRMRRPRQLVRKVHARLVERGYPGPTPVFSDEWVRLFECRE